MDQLNHKRALDSLASPPAVRDLRSKMVVKHGASRCGLRRDSEGTVATNRRSRQRYRLLGHGLGAAGCRTGRSPSPRCGRRHRRPRDGQQARPTEHTGALSCPNTHHRLLSDLIQNAGEKPAGEHHRRYRAHAEEPPTAQVCETSAPIGNVRAHSQEGTGRWRVYAVSRGTPTPALRANCTNRRRWPALCGRLGAADRLDPR